MPADQEQVLPPSAKDDVVAAISELLELLEAPEPEPVRLKPGEIHPLFRGTGPDILQLREKTRNALYRTRDFVVFSVDPYTILQAREALDELTYFTPAADKKILAERLRHMMEGAQNRVDVNQTAPKIDWFRATNPFFWIALILSVPLKLVAALSSKELFLRAAVILLVGAAAFLAAYWNLASLKNELGRITIALAAFSLAVNFVAAVWPTPKRS